MVIGFLYLLFINTNTDDEANIFSRNEVFYLIVFAAIWTFFCGVDGLATQKLDWAAHNAKYYDLFKNSWPNFFAEQDRFSCYYFGYYLVPAFLSKQIGHLLPCLLIVWTGVGFFLGLAWIFILIGRNKFLLLLMPFLRGTGQLAATVLSKFNLYDGQIPLLNPSMRSVFQQSSYAPNQVIAAMIVTGVTLYSFKKKKLGDSFTFIVASFIWAIFPSIILVLIFASIFINQYFFRGNLGDFLEDKPVSNYVIPGLVFLPIFGYFLSSDQISDQGFLWDYRPYQGMLYGYLTGIVLDILFFYATIRFLSKNESAYPKWFVVMLFMFVFILSTYYMGMFNDFFFRGSIPLQIIIVTILLAAVNSALKSKSWPSSMSFYSASLILTILIIVGMASEVHLLRDNCVVAKFLPGSVKFERYSYDRYPNTYQTIKAMWGERGAKEYLGAKNSFFERHLSKKLPE